MAALLFPSKPHEFSKEGGMRRLVALGEHDKEARLQLYRCMGYSWHRLKELGILTDQRLDEVR